jgi:YVTN family beta-propeller protein
MRFARYCLARFAQNFATHIAGYFAARIVWHFTATIERYNAAHRAMIFAAMCILLMPLLATAQTLPDFQERTAESLSGLANDDTDKSVELADFNADGLEDLVIARRNQPAVLLINEAGVLTNRTDVWLGDNGHANSNYAEAFDANNDGFDDVVFATLGPRTPRLYLNRGLSADGVWLGFDDGRDVGGTNDGSTTNSLIIESGDVNADGAADLFIIQVELATNRLLLNDGTGRFTDATERLGELGQLQRGHNAMLADVDSDNDIDIIYVESDLFLHIYYNDGDGFYSNALRHTFRNTDDFSYIFGAADFNGDGYFDYRNYSNTAPLAQMSSGITNSAGLPVYIARQDPPMVSGNRKHGFVHMRDIDGDGDQDYVLSSMLRNFGGLENTFEGMRTEVVINTGVNSGRFVTFTGDDWGRDESMDMKIIDINDDGNMDLFVAHQNRYAVYLNNAAPKRVEIQSVQSTPQVAGLVSSFNANIASGTDLTFEWDFGDGNVVSTAEPSVEYVYNESGRYLVTLTVRSEFGSDSISYRHRVHQPLADGSAAASSSIVVEQGDTTNRVWVANPDNGSVSVLNAQNGTLIQEITIGGNPRALAIAGDRVLVTGKADAVITAVSTDNLTVIDSLQLQAGDSPHGIVQHNGAAYVVLEGRGEVIKIDVQTLAITSRADVGANPRFISISADGNQLLVPRFITRPVAGESTRTVSTAAAADVLLLSVQPLQVNGSVLLPYNNVDDSDASARGVFNYLMAPAISPAGNSAIVGAKLDNIYRGSMRDGNAREHNKLVRGMMATLDLQRAVEVIDRRFDFDNNSQPTAMAFGPTGNLLFVVHEASRLLEVIDIARMDIIYSTGVGFAPQGLALSSTDNRLYVDNYLSRDVAVFDVADLLEGRSDNLQLIRTTRTVAIEALPAEVLEGKRLFHDAANPALSAQKYLSCATCHSEMGHDGRVWDFSDVGEGLRNTIDLRGRAGTAHGNVHWTANFDEIHDFENDIREVFDGAGLMDDTDYARTIGTLDTENPKAGLSDALDALADFIGTLDSFGVSPHRTSSAELTQSAQRGKAVFKRLNCATCHSGKPFTDSVLARFHNIGTVDADTGNRLGRALPAGGLDTPTLRGLWHGAPYLHDGSAPTLVDAVRSHRALTGSVAISATSAELNDLVSYLLQIDDLEPVAVSAVDNDGDLLLNPFDDDDDNDGVPDINDSHPFDASESEDNDADGIGDNRDPDDDNDGIADSDEDAGDLFNDSDGDGVLNRHDLDSDNDSLSDVLEATGSDAGLDGLRDGNVLVSGPDRDSDGLSDEKDIESLNAANNGDGPFDILQSQYAHFDTNDDGRLDALDGSIDANNDGIDDRLLLQRDVDVGGGCVLIRRGGGKATDGIPAFDPVLLLLLVISMFSHSIRRLISGLTHACAKQRLCKTAPVQRLPMQTVPMKTVKHITDYKPLQSPVPRHL